jgi:hypothetical protein
MFWSTCFASEDPNVEVINLPGDVHVYRGWELRNEPENGAPPTA